MAKRYYSSSRDSSINHKKDKFNDKDRDDKDKYPRGLYERPVVNAGFYGDPMEKRRQEMQDAGMIREDHRAIANLPQEVMIKPYPKVGPYMPECLEDSVIGVDAQMDFDDSRRKENFYPKKV